MEKELPSRKAFINGDWLADKKEEKTRTSHKFASPNF